MTPQATITQISDRVRPAYDYSKPDWQFPEAGKVIALGFESTSIVQSTYGRRVHFWSTGHIQRKSDIPDNITAIFIYRRVQNDNAEFRRIQDIARSRNLPVFCAPSNNELGREFDKLFRGASLAKDPDKPETAKPAVSEDSSQVAGVNTAHTSPFANRDRGWVRKAVSRIYNRSAANQTVEAKRIQEEMRRLYNYEISLQATLQHIYMLRPSAVPIRVEPKKEDALAPQHEKERLETTVRRFGLEATEYLRAIESSLETMLKQAEEVSAINRQLRLDVSRLSVENKRLAEELKGCRRDSQELAEIKRTLGRFVGQTNTPQK